MFNMIFFVLFGIIDIDIDLDYDVYVMLVKMWSLFLIVFEVRDARAARFASIIFLN